MMTEHEPEPIDSEEDHLTRVSRFEEIGLSEPVLRGVREAGFEKCTPIQALVLPQSLAGLDIIGKAQTGTGKTAAFLLTIFERFLKHENLQARSRKESIASPLSLIMAPTRELALQIGADAEKLGKHTGIRFTTIVGGSDYDAQRAELSHNPEIVVATPGRLIDLYKQKILTLRNVRIAVIDEADRMFDLGFYPDIRYLMQKLPPYDRRQTLLFSATVSYRVTELSYMFMNAPVEVDVSFDQLTAANIDDQVYHLGNDEKLSFLLGYLKREAWQRAIIFTNTKSAANWLDFKLRGNGYSVAVLTGDLTQAKRLQTVRGFKDGDVKILIATDIASRGLHVEEITHVVNFDVPEDPENYVHRIGRTARAGKSGKAVTFACERYVESFPAVEKLIGRRIPAGPLANSDFLPDLAGPYRPVRPAFHGGPHGKPRPGSGNRPSGGRSGPGRSRGGRSDSRPGERGGGRRHGRPAR